LLDLSFEGLSVRWCPRNRVVRHVVSEVGTVLFHRSNSIGYLHKSKGGLANEKEKCLEFLVQALSGYLM